MDTTTRHPTLKPVADGHPARHVLMIMIAAAAAAAVCGSADAASLDGSSLAERVQLNGTVARGPASSLRVTQSIAEPLATAGPLGPQDALRGDSTQSARQTMLWAEHPRSGLGLGIGVEQRRPYGPAAAGALVNEGSQPQSSGGLLVGASLATGPRSHLVVQTPLQSSGSVQRNLALGQDPQLAEDQQRQVRVGLVFNTKKPLADLRKGFRMELSGQSSLTVKPRGGKIGLAFQKVW